MGCALALVIAPAALVAAVAPPAVAVPIGVRAKTHVLLEHRRTAAGLVLVGQLLDDASQPIGDERISLELPGLDPSSRLTTGDGRFEVALDAKEVSRLRRDGDLVLWTARFDGNSRLGDTAETGTLDLSKRSTRLRVVTGSDASSPDHAADPDQSTGGNPAPFVLGDRPIDITVELVDVSDGIERAIPEAEVALEVGSGAELVGATGRSGSATFVVRPATLGNGGRYHVTARFAGDSLHGPSRAETDITVLLPTRITLRVVREGDAHQGRFRMSGRVSDQIAPLAGQVVALIATTDPSSSPPTPVRGAAGANGAPAANGANANGHAFELVAATDADGVFVTALSAAELQTLRDSLGGHRDRVRLDVRARFTPADAIHAPSESAIVVLEIPPPPGVPLRWYLVGLGVVVAFIALAQALRSGSLVRALAAVKAAIRRLLDRLRGRRPIAIDLDGEPAFVTRVDTPDAPRARTSDTISGVVVDAHTRKPLAARITARSTNDRRAVDADARGRFDLGPLAPGAWLVEVESPGHLPREVALEVPHNGDYDGAQWALIAIHRTVRDIFAGAVGRMGAPLAWGYATPREASAEALDAVPDATDRDDVAPPLEELTGIVEHTHFAKHLGTPADVERARALRQRLDRPPPERRNPAAPVRPEDPKR